MPEIVESVHIADDARDLWCQIGEFGAVGRWHPMLAKVECEGDRAGCRRVAETRDGSRQTERLLEFAREQHFYRYRMESTVLPVHNYIGEFRFEDCADQTSNVVWSARFDLTSADASDAVEGVRSFMKAGLDHLASLHSSAHI
jgi:mxaD protein